MKEILLYLFSGGVMAAVVVALEHLVIWKLNRNAAKADKAEEKKEDEDKKQSDEIAGLKTDVAALKLANKVILHDRIKYLCRSFIKAKCISYDDRQDLIDMHDVYHANGGNGNLDDLMGAVKKLPLKDLKED